MTHKSLLAPPVCHVSTHNNCVECLWELSWHGLFVTSGLSRDADLALSRLGEGGGGKSHTNSFCMGSSASSWGLHSFWEPVCSGRAWQWDLRGPKCVGMQHQGFICWSAGTQPLHRSPDHSRGVTLLVAFHAGGEQMPAQAGSRGCLPDLPPCAHSPSPRTPSPSRCPRGRCSAWRRSRRSTRSRAWRLM